MKERYKNPYFWVGLVSVMVAASGVDFTVLSSWHLLGEGLIQIVSNPLAIISVGLAALGIFVDPTTKGIK